MYYRYTLLSICNIVHKTPPTMCSKHLVLCQISFNHLLLELSILCDQNATWHKYLIIVKLFFFSWHTQWADSATWLAPTCVSCFLPIYVWHLMSCENHLILTRGVGSLSKKDCMFICVLKRIWPNLSGHCTIWRKWPVATVVTKTQVIVPLLE